MTLKETVKQLKALGTAKVRAQNAKSGAGDNQFGVSLGDIRGLAKKIRTNHELALSLWETGNVDAQFLATLLIQPQKLSADAMDRMVRSITFVRVADWLNSYVVRQHPDKEALRQTWMRLRVFAHAKEMTGSEMKRRSSIAESDGKPNEDALETRNTARRDAGDRSGIGLRRPPGRAADGAQHTVLPGVQATESSAQLA
jgi:hypothetical protein